MLLFFLGRPSMAALVALTIPFSLLVALVLMYFTRHPHRPVVGGGHRLRHHRRRGGDHGREHRPPPGRSRTAIARGRASCKMVLAAALEVERPVFFSVLMIIGAYLPLLSLTSIEGLLFRPMALTLVFALMGALFFALFVVPVLATFLFRHGYREWENPLLRWFRPVYAAILRGLAASPLAGGGGGGGLGWRSSSCAWCRGWGRSSCRTWTKG